MTPKARLVLATLALLVLGAACSGGGDEDAGRLTVTGRAEVAMPGEKAQEERGTRTLKFGEGVKVVEGTAVIRLDQGRQLELRTGTNVVLERVDDDGDEPAVKALLLENDLLVHAPPGARLTVSTEGADVIVSVAAQISRGPVRVVSSYKGDVEVRSGDQSTAVPALRELSIGADGTGPGRPAPLSYNADDPWDRRQLGEAIEMGNELEARSKGFSGQLGTGDGRTADFLLELLPRLADEPSFAGLFDPVRPPGESLVGAAIALEGIRGSFAERWAAIFVFRDEGAQWGLVALDQGVTRAPLLAAVDAAIGRGPQFFGAIPPPGGGATPGGGGTSADGGGTSGSTSGGRPTPTTPGSSPPSVTVPTTVPAPSTGDNPDIGPVNTGIPLIDQTNNALVEALTSLLRGLGGS